MWGVAVLDGGSGFEVGDGAGDLEDAVVGAGAHVHALHGVAEFLKAGGIGFGIQMKQFGGHLGVAIHAFYVLESLCLNVAGSDDACTDSTRWFTGLFR